MPNYDHIKQLIRDGKRDEARRLLIDAVKENPKDPYAWYGLAQVIDDREKKLQCLQKAAEIAPNEQVIKDQIARLNASSPTITQVTAPVNLPLPTKKGNNKQTINLIIGCLGVMVMILLVCAGIFYGVGISESIVTPTQKHLTNLTYNEIIQKQRNLTGVQWDAYEKTIMGSRVQWTGYVSEIKPDITGTNYIWIKMSILPGGLGNDVYFSYPEKQSMKYSKGQKITFRGDYDGGIEIFGFTVELTNAEILD